MVQITREAIEDMIVNVEYAVLGKKTTICTITLDTGFEVVGTSACIYEDNFDINLGRHLAYENAMDKLWEFEAYLVHVYEHIAKETKEECTCEECNKTYAYENCDDECEDYECDGDCDNCPFEEDSEPCECDCQDTTCGSYEVYSHDSKENLFLKLVELGVPIEQALKVAKDFYKE
jgi:rRNA processing protein Krr1/Pno1